MNLTQKEIKKFQKKVLDFYRKSGRKFPWRETHDPYNILVSEIMLQQTQADRVVPKYEAFIAAFPTFKVLAHASVTDIFGLWHGLGYNRRALFLKRCAQVVYTAHKGKLPKSIDSLTKLPGIGPYTAAAVCAFAFKQSVPVIETNIRTVFIHEFFHDQVSVADKEILPLIKQVVGENPREWYWALMDYGAMLKKKFGNASRKSKHYTRQSKFAGSNRQIRGMILKILLETPMLTMNELIKLTNKDLDIIQENLEIMEKEGFIKRTKNQYSLVS